ncbi:sodium:proton antiporter [Vibrio sp. 10N.286.49.B3]|uniref:iron-sulfur cluster carrier protein ApbC n=1 Tax=Vibrio sp. 10N.286.49.B3 TaxID=1880855 RepID=UPI000C85035F|nr:iron-sulfur cluster carrier protein ApbC [Vibrio sp. 10N.286.49.B3]PMH46825.1 sodium:proton antiporter [Vibrio sp. 10N.286.49.B3]
MRQFSDKQQFCQWLNEFQHPLLINEWALQPSIVTVLASGIFEITLPFAASDLESLLNQWISTQQQEQHVATFKYQVKTKVRALQTHVAANVKNVKNIIAVSSAKGGVGKSTTSVNLALALASNGASVGLLDADIYGPSVPMMIGKLDAKPAVKDDKWMQPIDAHGIYTHSIGYLVDKGDAAIWRGPMASKALAQLLNETQWPELDYLVIDMPPGTGDIQITISQQIPVTGALVVTTPQDLALADAQKGVAMFDKVEVPVVGVVENMSYHICSQCGHKEAIFGSGGAVQMASEMQLNVLAQIPLHISLREDIDQGKPTVIARPDSEHSLLYRQLADRVACQLYWQGEEKPEAINISMVE